VNQCTQQKNLDVIDSANNYQSPFGPADNELLQREFVDHLSQSVEKGLNANKLGALQSGDRTRIALAISELALFKILKNSNGAGEIVRACVATRNKGITVFFRGLMTHYLRAVLFQKENIFKRLMN